MRAFLPRAFTGDSPAEDDVRLNVEYDNASKTGTLLVVEILADEQMHIITEESLVHTISQELNHVISEESLLHIIQSDDAVMTLSEESLLNTIGD